jgi:hypothetical protein
MIDHAVFSPADFNEASLLFYYQKVMPEVEEETSSNPNPNPKRHSIYELLSSPNPNPNPSNTSNNNNVKWIADYKKTTVIEAEEESQGWVMVDRNIISKPSSTAAPSSSSSSSIPSRNGGQRPRQAQGQGQDLGKCFVLCDGVLMFYF